MSAGGGKPRFRLPGRAPTALESTNQADWDALVETSLARATEAADRWHTGLAGLVTVLTGLLVIKGPDGVGKLAAPWDVVVVVLFLGGTALMLAALWRALAAAAPPQRMLRRDEVVRDHVTVRASQVAAARHVLHLLDAARNHALAGLVVLLAGIALWWLAPSASPEVPAVSVVLESDPDRALCGTVVVSESGRLLLQPPSGADPVLVPLADVVSIRTATSCP